ncbi:MAG: WGR domain-containing protein [Myxococcaceae bacterium]
MPNARYFEQARADDTGRFWAVRVEDGRLITSEGDFGSAGSEQAEHFGTSQEALKAAALKISAAVRQGFREIVKAADPRDTFNKSKRAEYRHGLDELLLLEEKLLQAIREQRAASSRAGLDGLLDCYLKVVGADAQVLRAFLRAQGSTECGADPKLWKEVKDEMHQLVPVILVLKNPEALPDQVSAALQKLDGVVEARLRRTRGRMVPKIWNALGECELMELGRTLRSRARRA